MTKTQVEQLARAEQDKALGAADLLAAAQEFAITNDFQQACNAAYLGALPTGADSTSWETPAMSGRDQTLREVWIGAEVWCDADEDEIRTEVTYTERLDGTLTHPPRVRIATGQGDPFDATPDQARQLARRLLALATMSEGLH